MSGIGADKDDQWLRRTLRELERRIARMEGARSLQNASISSGGLSITGGGGLTVEDGGSVTIDEGGNVIVRTPGDMLLQDPDGTTVWQASTAPLTTDYVDANQNGLSIPASWTVMGYDTVGVPPGYRGVGHFIAMASCGDTMTDTGVVSVAVAFRFNYVDGTDSGWFSGPAIASPDNRIAVATSMWASNFTVVNTPAIASISIGAFCIRGFGTEDPGKGNFHVSGSVIFKRG